MGIAAQPPNSERSRWSRPEVRRPWAVAWALAALAALALAAWGAKPRTLHQVGNITYWRLAQLMPAPDPPPALSQINFKNFTYRLFPTEAAPDPGQAGIPDFAGQGQPIPVPVSDGHFEDRNNPSAPLEFDIVRHYIATLPHAPRHHLAIVFGIAYTGQDQPMCTGVIQTFAIYRHRLWLMGQITYDCRGGMNAQYIARKHQIRIASAVFAPGDRPCCPSLQDSANFKIDGRRFKPSDVVLAPGS